jgi:hypothetical protein
MKAIVNAFANPDEKVSIYNLQKASRACFADTVEVTEMLSYLTSYGKVINKGLEWIRQGEVENKPAQPERMHFLTEIMALITTLTADTPKLTEEVAKSTNLNMEFVTEALLFLEAITTKGYIKEDLSEGNYKFYIESQELVVK